MDPQKNSNPNPDQDSVNIPVSSETSSSLPEETAPAINTPDNPAAANGSSSAISQAEPAEPAPTWMPQAIVNGQPADQANQGSAPSSLPVFGGVPPSTPPKKSKKKLFIAAGVGLGIVVISLGTVFGYYVPNKPENVYKTGMSRSGKAIDKLVDQATEKDQLEQIKKGSELTGLLEVTTKEAGGLNGTFNVKLNPTKSDGKLDVKIQGSDKTEKTFGLKFLTELQKDKRFPDLYFQLTGLKSLGADEYQPGLSDYEGKWIAVEADFLESVGAGFIPPAEQKNKENISAEEIAELIRAISDASNEYLFTADPNKAVFENREYLGKEKTAEGINAFHYIVGVNAKNSVTYCKALSEKVLSQPATKKMINASDEEIQEYKKSSQEGCNDVAKDIKPEETFDMWIDAKYKVIHKVRFYADKDDKSAYTDTGQIYTGGGKIALFTKYHDDSLDIKLTLDVDIKPNTSKAELTASSKDDGFFGDFNIKGNLSSKPYGGAIDTTKPSGAIPIKDILARFGFDPTYLSGIDKAEPGSGSVNSGIQMKAKDSDRKASINAMSGLLEVYYADNGFYPSQAELNSKTWRSANMKDLTEDILTPPDSTNTALASAPSASQYSYVASECKTGGKQCQGYTLTALLSSGEKFTKTGANN